MDFLDDSIVSGKAMNIIQILRKLIKDLPEQFKFLFISRHQEYQFKELGNLSLDNLVIIRGDIYTKGFCVLGLSCVEDQDFIGYCLNCTDTSILIFLVCCFPIDYVDSVGIEIVPNTMFLMYLYDCKYLIELHSNNERNINLPMKVEHLRGSKIKRVQCFPKPDIIDLYGQPHQASHNNGYAAHVISSERAQNLFVNHNNLGLICPSIGKSRYFSSKRHELCVQFHCTKKGIIPIGNEHFPHTIKGCPTDVIESQSQLLSNLRIGDKVGPQTSTGTLGGFVRYLDVFDCFLTCAHVMYDLKTLFESSSNFARLQGGKAFIPTPQGQVECGIWRAFDYDDKSRTSVDAALVVLITANIDPYDILSGSHSQRNLSGLGLSSPFLNTSCLDHEEFCISSQAADTVSAGAMTKAEKNIMFPRQSDVDVQFSNTGATAAIVNANVYHPHWIYSQAHLQLPSGYLTERRIFRMYNQIALNLP
ncbi:unnamed protein product [Mytilus coruscus]|uniref:Uncharacterized protein n=1 Tax=Mytilus coruscus TaxID=42192 RepID=A0A6J8AZQ8_MYTCO|nr:unnamed protein product [Mytilus coruscus]